MDSRAVFLPMLLPLPQSHYGVMPALQIRCTRVYFLRKDCIASVVDELNVSMEQPAGERYGQG